jgi:hypothetical protein
MDPATQHSRLERVSSRDADMTTISLALVEIVYFGGGALAFGDHGLP